MVETFLQVPTTSRDMEEGEVTTTTTTIGAATTTKEGSTRVTNKAEVGSTKDTTKGSIVIMVEMTSMAGEADHKATLGGTTVVADTLVVVAQTSSLDVGEVEGTFGPVVELEMMDSEEPQMTLCQKRRKIGPSPFQGMRGWKSKTRFR